MARKTREPVRIDLSKVEKSIAPLPAISSCTRRAAYSDLHDMIRGIKPTEWLVVPGSSTWTAEQKQAVRTSIIGLLKKEKLLLAVGVVSATGSLIVYLLKCKGAV